jgi:hypothetical protein
MKSLFKGTGDKKRLGYTGLEESDLHSSHVVASCLSHCR